MKQQGTVPGLLYKEQKNTKDNFLANTKRGRQLERVPFDLLLGQGPQR